jgi:hypothetical protein
MRGKEKWGRFILFLSCAAGIFHNFAPQLHPVCGIYLRVFIAKVKVEV